MSEPARPIMGRAEGLEVQQHTPESKSALALAMMGDIGAPSSSVVASVSDCIKVMDAEQVSIGPTLREVLGSRLWQSVERECDGIANAFRAKSAAMREDAVTDSALTNTVPEATTTARR